MIKDTIKSTLSSITPLISNEIVKILSLRGEYTMAFAMIISEMANFLLDMCGENLLMLFIFAAAFLITLKMNGIDVFYFSSVIKQPMTLTVSAMEKYMDDQTNLFSSIAFKSVNLMLIKKYAIKKLRYLQDCNFDIVVDDLVNHKLEDDLFVTVKRSCKQDDMILITLCSYNKDLNKIVSDAIDYYADNNKKYQLKLIGTETKKNTYNYPEVMKYLTFVLIDHYGMTKLKIVTQETKIIDSSKRMDDENIKNEIKNATKSLKETKINDVDNCLEDIKNMYLLENCEKFKLEDDVYITIERNGDNVIYTLVSNTVDLKEFINSCIQVYKNKIVMNDYKYMLKLTGLEIVSAKYMKISYPKNLIALCDRLIRTQSVNNFRIVENENKKSVRIIDDISNVCIDDVMINAIKTIQSPNMWEKNLYTTYILESNTVDLTEYLENCVKEYELSLVEKNRGTIYYFRYLGKFGTELKFSKTILSSTDSVLTETFDTIHNEHSERLKNEIDKLKDVDYYKRTGLRKKKSYLFYGEPGCGKNASVVAMALYDNRHIIDIPFSILQYNSEFFDIMNLTEIKNVPFKKDQVIYMFDEMHTGLAKICKGLLQEQNVKKDCDMLQQEIIDKLTNNDKNQKNSQPIVKLSHDSLDLGCVLSILDGIGNYGGVIYVGLTNYIERIPEPLKRSLRLTPVYFTYLRKCDVVTMIEKFFSVKLADELVNKIPDRQMTPARLRVLCEQYENSTIDDFVEIILNESKLESRQNYCDIDNTEKYLNSSANKNIRKSYNDYSDTESYESDESDESDE